MDRQQLLRRLPKVDTLINQALIFGEGIPHAALLRAARDAVEALRGDILAGSITAIPDDEVVVAAIISSAKDSLVPSLRPVINATGIVLHTNLGRAPLSERVADHVRDVAMGYSTLEYDLKEGVRGSRHDHVESLICEVTGAEAAMAVNNNAAAVLLMLSALCEGREVIVSRGELVEIGGSFRVPEVMEQGGAVLREVGTTNKTHPKDYEKAICPDKTGALLKVHTSNYRVIGFTSSAPLPALSDMAKRHNIPLLHDLGSGALLSLGRWGDICLMSEPTVQQSLSEGADLVSFSGDKLLGGPQAGIIAGKKELIQRLKSHPLARALRIDKLTLAALEATLRLYLDPDEAVLNIPTVNMLCAGETELKYKAEALINMLPRGDFKAEIIRAEGQAGGGSFPGEGLMSWAVAVEPHNISLQELEALLRRFDTPIIARISKERLLLDVRTVPERDFATIAAAFYSIFSQEKGEMA